MGTQITVRAPVWLNVLAVGHRPGSRIFGNIGNLYQPFCSCHPRSAASLVMLTIGVRCSCSGTFTACCVRPPCDIHRRRQQIARRNWPRRYARRLRVYRLEYRLQTPGDELMTRNDIRRRWFALQRLPYSVEQPRVLDETTACSAKVRTSSIWRSLNGSIRWRESPNASIASPSREERQSTSSLFQARVMPGDVVVASVPISDICTGTAFCQGLPMAVPRPGG